jgi:hypothetical protein
MVQFSSAKNTNRSPCTVWSQMSRRSLVTNRTGAFSTKESRFLILAKLSPRRGLDLADFYFVMFTFLGDNFAAIGQEPI